MTFDTYQDFPPGEYKPDNKSWLIAIAATGALVGLYAIAGCLCPR